ncbi:MAG: acyltransferase family protein [Halodesulfovibrio sp.]
MQTAPHSPEQTGQKQRLAFLDSLRALGILLVVGIHAQGYCLPLPELQQKIVFFIVHTAAVPIFYLVDGYLIGARIPTGHMHYAPFMKQSSYRLLIPWLAFTVFYTVARYLGETAGILTPPQIIGQPAADVLISAYSSVFAPQLYFLVSLFLLRALYPLTKHVILDQPLILSCATLILGCIALYAYGPRNIFPFSLLAPLPGQEPIIHALLGLPSHACGMLLYRVKDKISLPVVAIISAAIFAAATTLKFGYQIDAQRVAQYSLLLVLFACFSALAINQRWMLWLGKNTMGIYLLHTPILLKVLSLVINRVVTIPLLSFFLIGAGAVAASALGIWVLRHIPGGRILLGEK